MQMNASSIVNQKAEWEKLGVKLPAFDHAAMTAATKEHPIWVPVSYTHLTLPTIA